MDTAVEASTLVDNRWYVFATTPTRAKRAVKDYLGRDRARLVTKATGLVRPMEYDYSVQLGRDITEDSLIRYRVDAA